MNDKPQRLMLDLGWCLARLDIENNRLTVVSPADYSEGVATPVQDVVISGKENLLVLRDALVDAYPLETKPCQTDSPA